MTESDSTVQHITVRYSTVQYSTVQCHTLQYSTVQDSRADRTNVTGNFVMGETPRQPVLVPFLLGSQQPPSEGDMRNCTADRPCQYGEGVCTEDSHCVPRLGTRHVSVRGNIQNIKFGKIGNITIS